MARSGTSGSSPFPDERWGSESSWMRRPSIAFASTTAGSWLVRALTPLDRRLLLRARGRFTVLGPIGAPILLLTTTGSTSGMPRATPLLFVRDGDDIGVVGSNFGQSRHPAWSRNLLADPRATVTIGGHDVPVTAELLDGDERDHIWRLFTRLAGVYDVYRERTTRDLRVFRLRASRL